MPYYISTTGSKIFQRTSVVRVFLLRTLYVHLFVVEASFGFASSVLVCFYGFPDADRDGLHWNGPNRTLMSVARKSGAGLRRPIETAVSLRGLPCGTDRNGVKRDGLHKIQGNTIFNISETNISGGQNTHHGRRDHCQHDVLRVCVCSV